MFKRHSFSVIIMILALSMGSFNDSFLADSWNKKPNTTETSLNYIEHAAISITHDDNFTDLGFSGTGTSGDPFLISNLNITTTATRGIGIYDTTKHFVITSCYIVANGYGIEIDNAATGTVTILNCTIMSCTWDGMYITNSPSVSIINSTILECEAEGIKFNSCPGSQLTNNTVQNNGDNGISLWHSSDSTLTDNTLTNDAVFIYDISVENYSNFTMIGNLVNEKAIGYFLDTDDLIISNPIYGQIFVIFCQRITIYNQVVSNGAIGIYLYYSDYAHIYNNTCNNNAGSGISLDYSDHALVENNTCNNNYNSIDLDISTGSTIYNNTCSGNFRSIRLISGDSGEILNNTVYDSGYIGYHIALSDDVIVANNTCIGSVNYGIYFQHTTSCIISYNQIGDCDSYGIYLDSNSLNNIIHHNNFTYNNLGGISQGYDDGSNNVFYDIVSLSGNWWSNWNGSATYPIAGSAGNNDPYPLGMPMVPEFSENLFIILMLSTTGLVVIYMLNSFKRKLRK